MNEGISYAEILKFYKVGLLLLLMNIAGCNLSNNPRPSMTVQPTVTTIGHTSTELPLNPTDVSPTVESKNILFLPNNLPIHFQLSEAGQESIIISNADRQTNGRFIIGSLDEPTISSDGGLEASNASGNIDIGTFRTAICRMLTTGDIEINTRGDADVSGFAVFIPETMIPLELSGAGLTIRDNQVYLARGTNDIRLNMETTGKLVIVNMTSAVNITNQGLLNGLDELLNPEITNTIGNEPIELNLGEAPNNSCHIINLSSPSVINLELITPENEAEIGVFFLP